MPIAVMMRVMKIVTMRKLALRKCSPPKTTINLKECATNVAKRVIKPSNARMVEVVEDTAAVTEAVEAEEMLAEAVEEAEADLMECATYVAK